MTRDAILHHHKRGMDRRQLVTIYGRDPVTLALGEEPGVIAAAAVERKAKKTGPAQVNVTQYDVLRLLCRHPMTATDIAARLGRTAGCISKNVEALRSALPAYGVRITQDEDRRLIVSDRSVIERVERVVAAKWARRMGIQMGPFDISDETRRLLDLLLSAAPLPKDAICEVLGCAPGAASHRIQKLREGLDPHGFGVLLDENGYRLSHPQEIRAVLAGVAA